LLDERGQLEPPAHLVHDAFFLQLVEHGPYPLRLNSSRMIVSSASVVVARSPLIKMLSYSFCRASSSSAVRSRRGIDSAGSSRPSSRFRRSSKSGGAMKIDRLSPG